MGSVPEYIVYLLDPARYAHPAGEPKLIQTHVSYVILAGDFVYKWKKPVDFGFIDFSTLARRKWFCEEELRLNSRLCPDIYLEVVRLFKVEGGYLFGDVGGETWEYGVKMSRLPQQMMMNEIITRGELTEHHVQAIVAKLVPFYRDAERFPVESTEQAVALVKKNVYDNFLLTEQFVGTKALGRARYEKIKSCAAKFLARQELFGSRIGGGFLRDCHGDLHSGNICLPGEVYIFDCIEFNSDLRCGDVAADIAFLAMDLDFHGLYDLSELFVNLYIKLSGDNGLMDILRFYQCYRAYVRGKIGLLTANDDQVDPATSEKNIEAASRYFELAEMYGEAA